MKRFNQKGFTLVELLVVITILAILATIGFTIFTGTQQTARDAKRKADIDSIATAMEVNYGKFSAGQYAGLCQSTAAPAYDCTQWFSGGLPTDPKAGNGVRYCWVANGKCNNTQGTPLDVNGQPPPNTSPWVICATLENATDPYCRQNRQ